MANIFQDQPPDPQRQRKTFDSLRPGVDDLDLSLYEYAVSDQWWKVFQKHLGYIDKKQPGQTQRPGPTEMNVHNIDLNIYIPGHQWKQLITWYGIADDHELDRRYTGPEKNDHEKRSFEICVMSPMISNLRHRRKRLDVAEYVGYIECQLRKVFHVQNHMNSRLWIGKKTSDLNLEPIHDRAEELQYAFGLEEGETYLVAIEVTNNNGEWPTGLREAPQGKLDYFAHVTQGLAPVNIFKREISQIMENMKNSTVSNFTSLERKVVEVSSRLTKRKEAHVEELNEQLQCLVDQNKKSREKIKAKRLQMTQAEAGFTAKEEDFEVTQAKFNSEREEFYQEKAQMEKVRQIQENIVKLNVGGHLFTTSTLTLQRDPDSMLAVMFSGRHKLVKDENGAYFIDRDGTHFRHILNYLRDGKINRQTIQENSEAFKNEILDEAEFFQINGLIDHILWSEREQERGTMFKHDKGYDIIEEESDIMGTLFTKYW